MEITTLLTTDDRAALRRWLAEHHQKELEVWVASYRGKQPMANALPYVEVVEEALCFGWIDSTCKRLPDGRLAQRLSPRRKNSHWTELNLQRCRDLEQRGLMTEAGRTASRTNIKKRSETSLSKGGINDMEIANMCSHLQRKLFDEGGEYHQLWLAMQNDPAVTSVVRSRQLHIYRNGRKVLVLAGKAAPKNIKEDRLCELLKLHDHE